MYRFSRPDVLTNYEQYYLDLFRANQQPQTTWTRLYSFAAAYGVTNLTASSLHSVKEDFKGYTSEPFHRYYDFNSVNARDDTYVPCSCDCKFRHICAIENIELDDFEQCYSITPCGSCTIVVSLVNIILALTASIFLQ